MTDSRQPPEDNSGFGSSQGESQPSGGYQPPTYDSGQSNQPGYSQGYGGGSTGTNGLAVAALVLGVLAILTCWTVLGGLILGLLAIILGAVGLSKAKKMNGSGRGLAIGGIVTGAIGLALTVALLTFAASLIDVGPGGEVRVDGTLVPTPPE